MLPRKDAIAAIFDTIGKTYGKRGEKVVRKNFAAVDAALRLVHQVPVAGTITSQFDIRPPVPVAAPEFVRKVTAKIIAGEGDDDLPVSALPVDGTLPTAASQWERRNIAVEIPVRDQEPCIQCGKCVLVCRHGVLRAKLFDEQYLAGRPPAFKAGPARSKDRKDKKYSLHPGAQEFRVQRNPLYQSLFRSQPESPQVEATFDRMRREPALDFLSANDAKLKGVPDPEVLGICRGAKSNSRDS